MLERGLRACAWTAFFLAVVLLPFRFGFLLSERPQPPVYAEFTDFHLYPADIFLLVALLLWGVCLLLGRRWPSTGPVFLWWPLLGILVTAAVSVPGAVDRSLALYNLGRLLLLTGLYLFVVDQRTWLRLLLAAVAVQLALQSAVAVVQFVRQGPVGLASLGEHSLDATKMSLAVIWSEAGAVTRAYGLTDHPNILAGTVALGLLLLLALIMTVRSGWRLRLLLALLALAVTALLFTFSTLAWLAWIAGLGAMLLLLLRDRQEPALGRFLDAIWLAILVLAIWIGAAAGLRNLLFGPAVEQRLAARAYAQAENNALVEAANQLFAGNALTGVGLGNLPSALQQRFPEFSFNYQPAHITLLDAAAEVGLFGGVAYALALLLPWVALLLRRDQLPFGPVLVAATGLLLTLTLIGFFEYYTWLGPGSAWQWLAWGVWATAYGAALGAPESRPAPAIA